MPGCFSLATLDSNESYDVVNKAERRFMQTATIFLTCIDDAVEKLEMIRNEIEVHVSHEFVGLDPKGGNGM